MPKQGIIDKNRIARNIKQLRKNFGETQEQLAEATGLTKSAISNYELGNRSDLETLDRIAEHYAVSLDTLLKGEVHPLKLNAETWGDLCKEFSHIFDRPLTSADRSNADFMRVYMRYRAILKKQLLFSDNLDILEQLGSLYDNGHKEAGFCLLILISLDYLTIAHVMRNLEYYDSLLDEEMKQNRTDRKPTEVLSNFYLPHFVDDISADDPEYEALLQKERDSWEASHKEQQENIAGIIEELREYDPEWMAFFDSFARITNLLNDEEEAQENLKIGIGMLLSLIRSKNQYAKQFAQILHTL